MSDLKAAKTVIKQ